MRSKMFAACALAALTLGACQQQNGDSAASSQPLAPPSAAETTPAPAPSALASAPPARVSYAPPARRYAYLDDAYEMSEAYADAPPDYAFDYGGGAPQVWRGERGVVRMCEPVSGGSRCYYFRPGSDTPYFVRDPEFGYGFDDGRLAIIYDSRGRQLDQTYADRQAWLAGRYLSRSHDLWRAAQDSPRREIEERAWREQQGEQARQRRMWAESRVGDPDWRAYHGQNPQAQTLWTGIAIGWAAAQAARPQPAPQGGGGQVHNERDAWRERMAQQSASAGAPSPQPGPDRRGPHDGPAYPPGFDHHGPHEGPAYQPAAQPNFPPQGAAPGERDHRRPDERATQASYAQPQPPAHSSPALAAHAPQQPPLAPPAAPAGHAPQPQPQPQPQAHPGAPAPHAAPPLMHAGAQAQHPAGPQAERHGPPKPEAGHPQP